jgi:UDP-N-acetylmuramate--alanine ligase
MAGEKFHLFGIAGRGMAPLAIVAKHLGADIDGCDRAGLQYSHAALTAAAVHVESSHSPAHVTPGATLVSTSIAPSSEPELVAASEHGAIWHRTDLLAAVLRARPGIGITGSHGKGTVTALTTAALISAGLDPVALIGANVPELGGITRTGDGPLVAEVDDSDLSLSRVDTRVAVVTNLDDDHPHLNIRLSRAVEAVGEFVSRASERVILGPSPRAARFAEHAKVGVWQYGVDFASRTISVGSGETRLALAAPGGGTTEAVVRLIGPATEANAALAWASALSLGADPEAAASGLGNITTISRRMELIGVREGVSIFDDFGGKHPVNVRRGLEALRRHFPRARITAVFEPYGPYLPRWAYRYARSLSRADSVIFLTPIFLSDYSSNAAMPSTWTDACSAKHCSVDGHDNAVTAALASSRPGDVVVFFGQVNASRQMALTATGLSE